MFIPRDRVCVLAPSTHLELATLGALHCRTRPRYRGESSHSRSGMPPIIESATEPVTPPTRVPPSPGSDGILAELSEHPSQPQVYHLD